MIILSFFASIFPLHLSPCLRLPISGCTANRKGAHTSYSQWTHCYQIAFVFCVQHSSLLRWHIYKTSINIFIGIFFSPKALFHSIHSYFVFIFIFIFYSFDFPVLCEFCVLWIAFNTMHIHFGNQFLFDLIDISFRCKIDWQQSAQLMVAFYLN